MIKQTKAEWLDAGGRKFYTNDMKKWRFKCPRCGHIQTGEDFEAIGQDWTKVYHECIGRYRDDMNCDWVASGQFKTLRKGRIITDDDADEVFEFADDHED